MAVSVDIVDAVDGRPVLVDAEGSGRDARRLAGVRPHPGADQILDRVWRPFQGIVLFVGPPVFDGTRLLVNGEHGIVKAIKLGFGLRLGWFGLMWLR